MRHLLPIIAGAIMTTISDASSAQVAAGAWGAYGAAKGQGHYADVNGVHLYYEIRGTGEPLVLLHGGLGAIEMFGPNLPILAKNHQVIAVDLQGHGRTADVDRPFHVETMADDIAALLEHLQISRADVMGYSLGGGVAFQVAARHPNVVRRLVLVSTPLRRNAFYPEMLNAQQQVGASAAEQMKGTPMWDLYMSLAPRKQDFPRLLDKLGTFMATDYDFTSDVAKITAPTLVVAGDADIFPPSHAVELFGLLGGGKRDGGWDGSGRSASRLAILPGLTHYTIFAAPELGETALRFLDEKGGGNERP
jgi:pimeloyl-ACP methyl ester carboxylesterase